jgi:hypothetical protein
MATSEAKAFAEAEIRVTSLRPASPAAAAT